ncbi:hypothetical protein [Melaminivora sp.]|uniref:hypothetical protein n=1 Tax=Melaminivora sp. TaxID=1933032 RepID=UPI0028A74DEC|nr:hypothetical protein [Melaminivora sp.]
MTSTARSPRGALRRSCRAPHGAEPGRPRRQRGDSLLEALIGILLLGVLGLGLSYAAGRIIHARRYASVQHMVLAQMREVLQTQGVQALCASPTPALGSLPVLPAGASGKPARTVALQVACTTGSVTVSAQGVAGSEVTLDGVATRVVLSSDDEELLGPGSLTLGQ